ncbi:hypothetical protein [Bremerella cremea]|uniref:hypothetical protein n=1 Tax=Bremerella cremea TaxID=1031537 RepID=UPI0031F005D0
MNLQLNDELLSAFLDGEVSQEERLQIETILADSPEWQKRYRQMVETVNAVRTMPEQPLPRDFSQDILAQIAARQQSEAPTAEIAQPQVSINTNSDRSSGRRLRHKPDRSIQIWISVAACLLVAVGVGLAYQAGIFGGGTEQILAQNDPQTVGQPKGTEVVEVKPEVKSATDTDVPDGNPFPSVEQLANDQNNLPMEVIPSDNPEAVRSPIGLRVNVRTKPGSEKPEPMMVRPNSLARSVFNLDPQQDPGLDRRQLLSFERPEVAQELLAWVDMDQDGKISDFETQQAWGRFTQTEGAVAAVSEEVLLAVDHDMNQQISIAELNLAIASIRWNSSETLRRYWLRLDANGDGVWTSEDFAANARFASMGGPALSQQLVQWHTLLDRSRDGNVTRLEFALSADHIEMVMKTWEQKILNPHAYEQTKSLMTQFDRDGNGQLAGRELMRLKEKQEDLAARLENAGPDGISAYELYLAIESDQL